MCHLRAWTLDEILLLARSSSALVIRVIEYENKRVDKLYLFIDGINHEGYYSPCYSDNNCLSFFPFPRISNKITYLSSNGTALDLLTSMPIKKKFSRLHRYWILWWGKIRKNAFFATVCCFNYTARWMDTVVKSAGIL